LWDDENLTQKVPPIAIGKPKGQNTSFVRRETPKAKTDKYKKKG
jgi:hypothetical protein